jgi:hypothetical protein
LNSALSCLEIIVFDFLEVKIVDQKSSRHDMILVKVLDEGLDSSFFDEFLLVE